MVVVGGMRADMGCWLISKPVQLSMSTDNILGDSIGMSCVVVGVEK